MPEQRAARRPRPAETGRAYCVRISTSLSVPEYRAKYGGRWLRDQDEVVLTEALAERVGAAVAGLVDEVVGAHGL